MPDYTGPEDGLTSDLVDAAPNSHGWQESFPLFINDSIIICPALISFSALIAHAFCQWLLHLDHTACLQITRPAVSELVPRTLGMKLELFTVFIDLLVGWFDLPLDRSQMSNPSLGIWKILPSFKIRWPSSHWGSVFLRQWVVLHQVTRSGTLGIWLLHGSSVEAVRGPSAASNNRWVHLRLTCFSGWLQII